MLIIGIGLDLVEVSSFKDLYSHENTDLTHVFVENEISYADNSPDRFVHLASRFAAKEAALKALGCGLQDGIALTDVVITLDSSGAPGLKLTGGALGESLRRGVDGWFLSLTHTETLAGAVAVAFSTGPR
jgi:holo-[acyl-carrier protein] synthase